MQGDGGEKERETTFIVFTICIRLIFELICNGTDLVPDAFARNLRFGSNSSFKFLVVILVSMFF